MTLFMQNQLVQTLDWTKMNYLVRLGKDDTCSCPVLKTALKEDNILNSSIFLKRLECNIFLACYSTL